MRKEKLLNKMEYLKENEKQGITLVVEIKDYPVPELIIVNHGNLDKKKEYIDEVYDDQLNHKLSDGVKIIDYYFADNWLKMMEEGNK